MELSLMNEVVVADDYWQFSVDHAIGEVMAALRTTTTTRISIFQGRAISELMQRKGHAIESIDQDSYPISFSEFASKMNKCLPVSPQGNCDETERYARWVKPFWEAVDRYAKLVSEVPLARMNSLTDNIKEDDDRTFVKETSDKLVDLTRELTDLVYVLQKNPADRWFRRKRELTDDHPKTRPKDLQEILAKVSLLNSS